MITSDRDRRRTAARAVGLLAWGILLATTARADVAPPDRAEVVIELVLQNQSAFPDLAFVVVDCWPALPPGLGFARGAESVRCLPRDPLSVYGISRAELERISARPAPVDAIHSVTTKGKPCGTVAPEDTRFSKETKYESAYVTYAIDAGLDGSCRMHKVSVVGETADQRRARVSAAATASSASSVASAPSSAPSDPSASPRRGCGACAMTTRDEAPRSALLLAIGLVVCGVRRRNTPGLNS